jgi:hypothetical protein
MCHFIKQYGHLRDDGKLPIDTASDTVLDCGPVEDHHHHDTAREQHNMTHFVETYGDAIIIAVMIGGLLCVALTLIRNGR